uniref:JNK-interacting protein leucine zipper II domain-containing protein n=1 Tax=Iconisemion striatum TaxID=60296 RepID=A0A1A7Z063_9TELE
MIHSYMEHLERTKHQHAAAPAESSDSSAKQRKERPISMGCFQLPGIDGVTPELHKEPADLPSEPWRFNNLSHPQSNTSLKDELSLAYKGSSKSSTPAQQRNVSKTGMPMSSSEGRSKASTPTSSQGGPSKCNTAPHSSHSQSISSPSAHNVSPLGRRLVSSSSDVAVESVDTLLQEQQTSDELSKNLDWGRGKPEGSKQMEPVQKEQETQESAAINPEEDAEKSEVQVIIESTPELDVDFDGCRGTSTPTKGGIENLAFNRNTDSLFEELSSAGNDLIGDMDEGADLLGMGREVEHLIHENTHLLETKNALNVLQPLLVSTPLYVCLCVLSAAPLFPRLPCPYTSSFSRLFSSSGGAGKKPAGEAPVNVKYNAPTSQIQPSVKKKSSTLQQLPSDKSKAFDFLNEEASAESVPSRREQKRAQYKQVKAHVQKEDGRVQAYGWSLPKKYKANGGQSEGRMKNLPVPVFLRPLDEKDPSMKLWCAAGVNLSGGKTRDGGSIVGASVFYSDTSGPESPKNIGSQSSLDKLDQELKEQQTELRHQDEFSSLVWISTSTQSTSKVVVIDANQPGNILESFFVCNSHVFCITSVPGARETDYPAGEDLSPVSEEGPTEDASLSAANSSSEGGDGILGDITVVGTVAVPQTADQSEEAMENSTESVDPSESLRGIYTEYVFTDPLGAQSSRETPANYSQRESDLLKDGVSSNPSSEEPDPMMEEAQKMSSVLPTMWMGAQNGCVYVHSSMAQWKRCLHSIKLKKPVVGIVHVKGRVLVSLSDSTIAIFHRGVDGQWDLINYHLLDLGKQNHSIRCMTVVHDEAWCGYRNKIYVVHPRAMRIEKSFDAHPRKDSQVRQLAWHGDGIWVSIKLDSTLRLFHARTYQHLQDIDIEPYVSKMLGTGKLGFSFVRITALMVSCNRLWIGTGNGVIISIPLTETNNVTKAAGTHPGGVVRVYGDNSGDKVMTGTFVPYCSMAHAQLSFHGHRNAVQFFTAVPGHPDSSASCGGETIGDGSTEAAAQEGKKSVLVMSGGEGYIDFRMGDEDGEAEDAPLKLQHFLAESERSHLIVWQILASED